MTTEDTTRFGGHESTDTDDLDERGVVEHPGREFGGRGHAELPAGGATDATVSLTGHSFDDEPDSLVVQVSAGAATTWVNLEGDERLAFLDEVHRLVTETSEADL